MAKIKLSSFGITNMSGKAGGNVYSRNRGGSYVKNFVMPSNTFTEARQSVRSFFGSISSAWRNLTDNDRNTWISQAPSYPVTDVFGDTRILSGNALHQSLNGNRLNAGMTLQKKALPPEGTNPIQRTTTAEFKKATNSLKLQYDLMDTNAVVNNVYVMEATPPTSASINNVENRFRIFALTNSANGTQPNSTALESDNFSTSDLTLGSEYISQFGEPLVGQAIHVRVYAVSPTTGEVSAKWATRIIAEA